MILFDNCDKKNPPTLPDFKARLHSIQDIEYVIAKKKNKLNHHFNKWQNCQF